MMDVCIYKCCMSTTYPCNHVNIAIAGLLDTGAYLFILRPIADHQNAPSTAGTTIG